MTFGIRSVVGTILISICVTAAAVGQDGSFRVPMNHIHGRNLTIVGAGVLELKERRLTWTETETPAPFARDGNLIIRSEAKHNFSVSCSEMRDAELHFPRLHGRQYWAGHENVIKARVLDHEYEFQSASGYSAIVILDMIRIACGLGEPVLESSKVRFTNKFESLGGPDTPSRADPMFDVFYEDGGGRGVLFVTRTGVVYEQVVVHQPPVPKLDWKGGKSVEIARTPPISLPCIKLTDITVRGRTTDGIFFDSNPQLDIHDGSVVHRFFLGANIYGQAAKQAIADHCSRN